MKIFIEKKRKTNERMSTVMEKKNLLFPSLCLYLAPSRSSIDSDNFFSLV